MYFRENIDLRFLGLHVHHKSVTMLKAQQLHPRMITSESKKVEHFIWGLSPQIQGNVIATNPNFGQRHAPFSKAH